MEIPKLNRAKNQALFTKDSRKKGQNCIQIILTDVISVCAHSHTWHANTTHREVSCE